MGNIFSILQSRYINYISNTVYKYNSVEKIIYSIPFITNSFNSFDSYISNNNSSISTISSTYNTSNTSSKNINLPNYKHYKEANLTF